MNHYLHHLADLLFNAPLLVEPGKLRAILAALEYRFGAMDLSDLPEPSAAAQASIPRMPNVQWLENGVAALNITGSLVHRASQLDAASGMTGYNSLSSQFSELMADGAVQHIVMVMNTHGGQVNGLPDLADEIYAARGVKPVTALVDEHAYSAGYWLAAAAEHIVVTQTAGVGSIGVLAVHVDRTALNERAGIKVTPVYAGARKVDYSPDTPLNDEARQRMQAEVDRLYDLFASTVARYRGISADVIRATEADTYTGEAAVRAGLATRVQPAREALADIIRNNQPQSGQRGRYQRAARAMHILSN